jgi:hypothetical protein
MRVAETPQGGPMLLAGDTGARPLEINLAGHRIHRKQVLGGLTHEYQIAA